MIEKLSTDRYVIINADDLGITRSTNQAIFELFNRNVITSASIMMPCLEAHDAANLYKRTNSANVGIHLTLTSAENHYLKPVYQKRKLTSLITKEGFFPHDASEIEQNADPEEVRIELEAQIQKAISYGIDPTHLDSHGGSIMGLHYGRDFLAIVFDLCVKYGLPFNLPRNSIEQPFFSSSQREMFAQRIELAKRRGIYLIDDLCGLPYHSQEDEEYNQMKKEMIDMVINLKLGITQIITHPSIVTSELKTLTPYYRKREMEFNILNDPEFVELLKNENIKFLSWKTIRDLQRQEMKFKELL